MIVYIKYFEQSRKTKLLILQCNVFLLFCMSVLSFELVKTSIYFMLGKEILVEEQEYLNSVFSKINFLIVIKKQITIDRTM